MRKEIVKELSAEQFMTCFNWLQDVIQWRVGTNDDHDGSYVIRVAIEDIPDSGNISVTFEMRYGPLADLDMDDDLCCVEMLEGSVVYILDKCGKFVSKEVNEIPDHSARFKPDSPPVLYDDLVDPEDPDDWEPFIEDVFKTIRICNMIGKPLHSIVFESFEPKYDCHYVPGKATSVGYDRWEDDGYPEEYEDNVDGICLSSKMTDKRKYTCTLKPCRGYEGEWSAVFHVSK